MEYYDINCIECGEVFKANEISFNIDEILKNHSEDIKRLKDNDNYDVFRSIKLKINYDESKTRALLEKGSITTEDLRKFLKERYDITISLESKDLENSINLKKNELEVKNTINLKKDEFDIQPKPARPNRRRVDFTEKASKIPEEILQKFKQHIEFRAKDVDEDTKKECYEQLYDVLTKDEAILEISDFDIITKDDDRGNSFPDMIKYTLVNGKDFTVEHLSCPICGAHIKGTLGEHKQYIIGMIGSARVGKTAYLASLVDRINPVSGIEPMDKNIFVKVGASGIGTDAFEKNILNEYRQNKKIPKTSIANSWVPVFCLDVTINGKDYIFTFVDMPGEIFCIEDGDENQVFKDKEFIMNTQKIIMNSDLLWFCLDPIQIDAIIQYIAANSEEKKDDSDKVVENIDKLIEAVSDKLKIIGIEKTVSKKKEAAILITKSDTIGEEYNLIEERTDDNVLTNLDEKNKQSYLNLKVHDEHIDKIRKYIDEKKPTLTKSFDDMFSNYNVFAVASYGIDVKKDNDAGKRPSNVEHPFLWTCAALGILPFEKEVVIKTIKPPKKRTLIEKILGINKDQQAEIVEKTEIKDNRELLFYNKK